MRPSGALPDDPDIDWLVAQIEAYYLLLPRYADYARVLRAVLSQATASICPGTIVEARPKSIASFAEKAVRKKYPNPLGRFTDLCGARVIVRTRGDVAAVSTWIEQHFEISWLDSIDTTTRLGPTTFGYGSMHYIVSFKAGQDVGADVPAELNGLKAEIQIRTLLQHAWASLAHQLSYKNAAEPPPYWQRELAIVAAELENADNALARIEQGLRLRSFSYPSHLTATSIKHKITALETVLRYEPRDLELACQVGNLACSIGDWAKAVAVLTPFASGGADPSQVGVLAQLGFALCKLHRDAPDGEPFRRGQDLLRQAGESPRPDPTAVSQLADTWRMRDDGRARELYRQAVDMDPANYHALARLLEHEIDSTGSTSVLSPFRHAISAALERCRVEADMGINSPGVLYAMAKLQLFRSDLDEALRTYCQAIRASTATFMVEDEIATLKYLSGARHELEGFVFAERLLLVGASAKFPAAHRQGRLAPSASAAPPIAAPVVIVAGGTDSSVEERLREYQGLLMHAFGNYAGTIISGGTASGISALVGDVGQRYRGRIRTIGYVPRRLPDGLDVDGRYAEIRRTDGDEFSAMEPLQYWADLIAAGVDPKDVKLLAINGGNVTAVELRLALAVGASVGVVRESGREADRLLTDDAWREAGNLMAVPATAQAARAFIDSGVTRVPPDLRETIGRAIHDSHRREASTALLGWDQLEPALRESSMLQADDILAKLRRIGCQTQLVTDRRVAQMTFADREVEILAEMEHERWHTERLSAGWAWGEKVDHERRRSPHLVPWSDLPDQVREWDRRAVRQIPEFLAEVQLEIRRIGP